ncbi:hypothetical protein HOY80DRAFT_968735 [Tuber brumale]|nr:hypothetical protein HOY80DRAFT_968735 [Tuber brumale]
MQPGSISHPWVCDGFPCTSTRVLLVLLVASALLCLHTHSPPKEISREWGDGTVLCVMATQVSRAHMFIVPPSYGTFLLPYLE